MNLGKMLFIAVAAAILSVAGTALAAGGDQPSNQFVVGSNRAIIDGRDVSLTQPAKIINGRVYLPLRYLLQAMQIDAGENIKKSGEMLIIRKDGISVILAVPRTDKENGGMYNTVWVGFRSAEQEQPIAQVPAAGDYLQAYVQVRPLAQAFDYDLAYSAETKAITLLPGKPLVDDDLMVSGLLVGRDNLDDMIKKFGQPQSLTPATDRYDDRVAVYPGLRATLQYSRERNCYLVARAEITSDSYWTARSLRVGDDFSRMVGLYGSGYYKTDQRPDWFNYWRLSDYWRSEGVEVQIKNERVVAICVTACNKGPQPGS
ncbi:MAG: copper amine oxidase N-terminal domain-containing protein [Negativicutes bacterium]|nr:copper amine oxidase N-terminal domain-containing protein [Negativicutes bacterium]